MKCKSDSIDILENVDGEWKWSGCSLVDASYGCNEHMAKVPRIIHFAFTLSLSQYSVLRYILKISGAGDACKYD